MVSPSGVRTETALGDSDTPLFASEPQTAFDEWEAHLPETDRSAAARREWIDVTPIAREIGLLPLTALTAALWADIQAIPPGFENEETIQRRLTNVLRHAFFALLEKGDPEKADMVEAELLVFPVCLPTLGQEISDYPVALLFRPGETHRPVLTLMTPEEAASVRLAKSPASSQ